MTNVDESRPQILRWCLVVLTGLLALYLAGFAALAVDHIRWHAAWMRDLPLGCRQAAYVLYRPLLLELAERYPLD